MDRALFFTRRSLALTCTFAMLVSYLVFGATTPVFASHAPIVVNDPGDETFLLPDETCDADPNPVTAPGNQCTLREAVVTANEHAGPDIITFDPAVTTVTLTIANASGDEDAAASGDLDVAEELTIDGGAGVRVIQDANDRVFEVLAGIPLRVESLSIESGSAPDNGGGILNQGELTITGTAVSGNAATGDGGGLFNDADSELSIMASVVTGNAAGDAGGGIASLGTLSSDSTEYVLNTATGDGGALFNDDGDAESNLDTYADNHSDAAGGAIWNGPTDESSDGSMLLDNARVGGLDLAGNSAAAGGGGILNQGQITIVDSLVSGNATPSFGGGILDSNAVHSTTCDICFIDIRDTLIIGNTADGSGGGIASGLVTAGPSSDFPGNRLEATNVDIRENTAGQDGGGFFGFRTDASVTDSAIAFNDAQQNGGGWAQQSGSSALLESNVTANEAGVPTETADTEVGTAYGGGLYLVTGTASIEDGIISANEALLGEGGGIWNRALLTLDGVDIADNVAGEGGGIYNGIPAPEQPGGEISATAITVVDNVAQGMPETNDTNGERGRGEGGGIWNDARLFVDDSSIEGNVAESGTTETAIGGEGGGVYNVGGVTFDSVFAEQFEDSEICRLFIDREFTENGTCILDSAVVGNNAQGVPAEQAAPGPDSAQAGKGGGLWNGGEDEPGGQFGLLGLDRVDVTSNAAALGGGLYNVGGLSIVTETAFVGNGFDGPLTGTAGGGAYVAGSSSFFGLSSGFVASTFADNEAGFGGGVYYGFGAASFVDNSTLNDNEAAFEGGAIWNDQSLQIENSTISQNTAEDRGGGIYNTGEVSSTANTIYQNEALTTTAGIGGNVHDVQPLTVSYRLSIVAGGLPQNCNDGGNHIDEGYNLDDDGTCFGEQDGEGTIIGEDPELAPLADNGGPTETHALNRNSPARNAVRSEECPPPGIDQRFFPRPDESGRDRCDIGSFEHQSGEPFPDEDPDPDGGGGGGGGGSDPDATASPTPSQSPSPSPSPSDGDGDVPAQCRNAPAGTNVIVGTSGPDELVGTDGADAICGLGGDDTIRGGAGNDVIVGNGGEDLLRGNRGRDRVRGGSGNDVIFGGRGFDSLSGNAGKDAVSGNRSGDEVLGNRGNDRLRGGQGNDFLNGGPDTDRCNGDAGTDDVVNCEPRRRRSTRSNAPIPGRRE